MRHSRLFSPSWLVITILLTYLTYTTTQSQNHLVCRRPGSQNCLVWLIVENNENNPIGTLSKTISTYCGLSNLRVKFHYRRYVQIESENMSSNNQIFCDKITIMGRNHDWQEILNVLETSKRVRRQTFTPRGRYRGQTQSQYLAIDRGNGKDEGKAEAHSAADSSRAVVSGNSGMGQAQSQSIYDPNCDDCSDRKKYEIENLKHPTSLSPGGSTWQGQNALPQLPNRGYNQNSADHLGTSPYFPTLGNSSPVLNGNGNQLLVPQNKGAMQPGINEADNRPIGTHGGYDSNGYPISTNYPGSINYPNSNNYPGPNNYPGSNNYPGPNNYPGSNNYPGANNYPGSNNYLGSNNYPGSNSYPDGNDYRPFVSEAGQGYKPISNSYVPSDTTTSRNLGPNSISTGFAPITNNNDKGYLPNSNMRPEGYHNPNTKLGSFNGDKQSPSNLGDSGLYGPQVGNNNYLPGYGTNKYNAQVPGNIPLGSQVPIANVGATPYGSTNELGKQNPSNQRESGLPHYPASGPYLGLGGSSVNGNMYPNYRPGDTNILKVPGTTLSHEIGRPGGQYGSTQLVPNDNGNFGQYGPTNTGIQNEPGSNIGGTVPQGTFSPTGSPYGNAMHPYRSTTGGGSYPPGNQLDPRGTLNSPDRPYSPSSPPDSVPHSGQYIPGGTGVSGGSLIPVGQYGRGNAGVPIGNGLQFGQNAPGSTGISVGPYGINNARGTPGVNSPADNGFPYSQSNSGTSTIPGGQYGVNVPKEQYGPSVSSGPGGQYGLNGHNAGDRPIGTGNQNVFPGQGGQYTPSENKGPIGNIGKYGSNSIDGEPARNYGPSSPIDSLGSRGQYEPGIGPSGEYRPNSAGGPNGNGFGGVNRPTSPGTSSLGNAGQYDSGNLGGSVKPSGQSLSFSPGGQNFPGGAKRPTNEGQFVPGTPGGAFDKYGHPSPGDLGEVFGPSVAVRPYDNAGRYVPSNSFGGSIPGGQFGQIGPEGNTGQYTPGTSGQTAGLGRPAEQYGANGPGTSFGPGGVTGHFGPNGIGTDQYGPGSSDGSVGSGRPYGSNVGQPGQLSPDATKGSFVPGSQYTPSGVGAPQGRFNNGGPGGQIGDYNGVPQNVVDPNSINADGDDSEAEASISQNTNGTTASASSKGGSDKGRAQTNVQGTYTGSGSFQAQAQITGENKEALSEVSGGKKGASSSASGSGRNNKSQANVQLGSETGSVQTQSQSNGVMHSSNSQVQGSVKGGMADAQARGPGSTSSQAQIGFTPYKDSEKNTHDLQKIPFIGGGMASAQSSGRTGQSQSQLHGTFKYGISYNGAAQSGASLDKDAIFPNRLSFEKINVFDEKEKNIDVDKISMDVTEAPENRYADASLKTETPTPPEMSKSPAPETPNNKESGQAIATENNLGESMKNSESRYTGHTHLDHHVPEVSNKTNLNSPTLSSSRRSFQTNFPTIPEYEYTTDRDDTQPEYDGDVGYDGDGNEANDVEQTEYSNYDEYTKDPATHQYLQTDRKRVDVQQTTGGNTQHIVLGALKNHNAEIVQKDSERPDESKVYQPGERVPGTGGYTIPIGFTGSVKSVASKENTYVIGSKDSPSQAQTVTLTPGTGKVKYSHPSSYGRYVKAKNLRSLQSTKENDNKYVSVSKSVTRALDSDDSIRKQYSHTYYTKSSSCGYFTFTCTMVSSAEGRKKVCKPKMPTNPDGTPIRC